MLSELKKYTLYFLLFFVAGVVLIVTNQGSAIASGIGYGVAIVSGACLVYLFLEAIVSRNKVVKKDKDLWYTETLLADNDAIFVFGEDTRSEADEIIGFVKALQDYGIQNVIKLTLFGKEARCAFWGNEFICPFKTTISNSMSIVNGKFYRLSDTDADFREEFTEISFLFLSELHAELKKYVSTLPEIG